jgi:hypothetical protein
MILASHGIIASSGGTFDANALNVINAIEGTGTILTTTQKEACNTLIVSLKNYGIWTKTKALYGFLVCTAAAHKFNWKDPRDLDAAYRLVFSGGFTHNYLGVVPNGTNSYANPFFMGTEFPSVNNAHISYYSQTSVETNVNSVEVGCFSGITSSIALNIRRPSNQIAGVLFSENNFVNAINTDAKGLYVLSRTANNSLKFYKNATTIGAATNIDAGATTPSRNVFLFTSGNALNVADGLYTTNKTSSLISLGDGLNDTEASNFYTAINSYQASLGRNV